MSLGAMVQYLQETGYIRSKDVAEAMLAVDRAHFVPFKESAYEDRPLPIGSGQTISAPSVVAFMLERLQAGPGMKVLEVGTGSGYNTALLSYLVGPGGSVVTFERMEGLAEAARKNLAHAGYTENVTVHVGDASCGYPDEAPYDRIIVTGGLPSLDKGNPMIAQLRDGGRMVAPAGGRRFQDIIVYDKGKGTFEKVLPVLFVPIIGRCGFDEDL